jgi:glycosyltransferase involved in cell wall biosynthesis
MIAYNHKEYIRQAVEGILFQQTDFEIEFVISNDCSTDATHETIVECITNYNGPVRIKYFNQEKNIGMMPNFIFVLNQTQGDYIALCEGDDYWTDYQKLQKQIDYISTHPDCKLVFTEAKVWNENLNDYLPNWADLKREKYEFRHLIERNVITTCTVLFRNPHRNGEISNYLVNFKIGDYPLHLLLLRSGYAHCLKEETAVYRQHAGGVFSMENAFHMVETNILVLETLKKMDFTLIQRYYIQRSLIKWYYSKMVRLSNDSASKKIRHFIKAKIGISDLLYNPPYFLRIVMLYFFPKLKSNTFN